MPDPSVAVIGGAVAGLAAAERFREFADVTLFERQSYEDKRVNCGEAINDATRIPLDKTAENGFRNDVDEFQLYVYGNTDRSPESDPYGAVTFRCDTGYICDRDRVEQRWAERLEAAGVDVQTDTSISIAAFRELIETYDYVVDATGQPSLTTKALGETDAYAGDMIALNADVEGDFTAYEKAPRIFFEGYVGYSWSFPKSATRANVGIGWAGRDRPDNYIEALWDACERNDLPKPARDTVNIYTIPAGPSLDPEEVYLPEGNVFLVGDAAGIANRYQGEGICQAIRSSYLLADLVRQNRDAEYPEELYELMKSEYRLARLMKGAWVEHRNPALLASIADCLGGLTIEDITRNPKVVMGRIAKQPAIAAQLLANRGMIGRIIDAYTDSWEY